MSADDIPVVAEMIRNSEAFDGVHRVLQDDELAEDLDDVRVRLATDTRLAEVDGRPVGNAYTFHLPSEDREERCYVFGVVDPAYRGRGVGRALMEWAIDRGSDQLRSSGGNLPKYLRVNSYDFQTADHRLFARFGFEPVRYFEELLRPLDDLPPTATVDGVRIIPWPDDRDEEIRIAKNVSFANHWGSTATSTTSWQVMVRGFSARPALSFVAIDNTDAVVGFCLNHRYESDDDLLGRRDGWIDSLGTLPTHQGRGIASALVAHSLHAFARAGLTHASIAVDSENPSGAARLYRNLGFEPLHRAITRQIVVV
jgi:mycothiol synthase